MKIAIISSVLPNHGGMGRVLDFEAKEFQKRNLDFTVFVPEYKNIKIDSNYKVEYLKTNLRIGFGAICFDLIKKINQENFDVVYLHYPAYGLAGLLLSKKIKQKIIIRYHMDVKGDNIFKKIFFFFYNKIIAPKIFFKADKIIFSSKEYGEKSFAKKFLEKSLAIPFGVDENKFNFNENVSKENQIIFVSKLDKQHYFKGLNNLLIAFSKIKNKEIKLKIVGNGKLLKDYQEKSRELNIEDRVDFLTNVNDEKLKEEYQKSICEILPSINKNEAFGLVLIESFACGVPVIASNLPGVSYVVGDRGYVVKSNNIEDLKNKIDNMVDLYINKRDEYNKLKEKCLLSIKNEFNWKYVSENVEKILTKDNI